MTCLVKDKKTFRTLCVCPVLDFDVTIWSIYDEVSTFKVSREKEMIFNEGDIVVFANYCGIIKEAEVTKYTADLKCEHILKMFSRDIPFVAGPDAGPESFLKNQIDEHYTNQTDIIYQLPYLDVSALTSTVSSINPDVEDGVWNIKSYIAKIRRVLNIFTEYTATKDTLEISIGKKQVTTKQIDLSDSQIKVLEETYSNKSVGKITSICEETEEVKDWFLLDDGTITDTYQDDNRVVGDWVTIVVSKAEDVEYKVRDEFAKNSFSHKILFNIPSSRARFAFYDRILIASKGRLYYSYIAAVRNTKSSEKTEYQCGELRTTFTDKIQEEL